MDHDRPTDLVGERELGVEQRALLPQGVPAVVAVQARLTDCDGARVLERGYYVSFAGNVTYPRAEELRRAAAEVPADRILAETDSPYLAPQPVRGGPNEPAHVRHTVATLALARQESPDELEARIDENATRAFGLDGP